MVDGLDLAGLLAIWPVAESFASQTPVGDLITLGRTSSTLRSSLHGRIPDGKRPKRFSASRDGTALNPAIGKHQTIDWIHLKSIAPFHCSSATHTRGKTVNPCVYCSRPICDACIVRSSFKNPSENTFKNRLRYFCRDCWSEGRPTRKFRYAATPTADNGLEACDSNDLGLDEKPYFEADDFCECNLKDNGWLCLECKDEQNSSTASPSRLVSHPDPEKNTVQCFGLDCTNAVDLNSPDKDRRRVCLWCQKPLRRQWGGEDRFAWNLKTIEARARNAESRSRDLEEYNRRRLQVLRMSRKEMRGTSNDETPVFVRHLDAINYRNFIAQDAVPTPEDVWKSKNGFWRYHPAFFYAVQRRCKRVNFTQIGGVSTEELSRVTREGAAAQARLNREMYPDFNGNGVPRVPEYGYKRRDKMCLNELKARIFEMRIVQGLKSAQIVDILTEQYGFKIDVFVLQSQMMKWQDQRDWHEDLTQTRNPLEANVGATASAPEERESETSLEVPDLGNSSTESIESAALLANSQDEVNIAVEDHISEDPPPAPVAAEDQGGNDPPPYVP